MNIIFLRTSLIVILMTLVVSCGKRKTSNVSVDAEKYQSYIAAFPSNYISRTSAIRIVLSGDIPSAPAGGEAYAENLIDVQPKIEGKTFAIDSRTIEFRPSEKFESGKEYLCKFHLGKLFDVPKDLKTAAFTINTVEQNFKVDLLGYRPYEKANLEWNKLSGIFHCSDYMETQEVIQVLNAEQQKLNKSITILSSKDNNRTFEFEIDSIQRKDHRDKLVVSWNGNILDFKTEGVEEFEIPALGEFEITDVNVVQYPQQKIQVYFSDPLDESQLFDGLIQLGTNNTLNYDIDYNMLNIYPDVRQTGKQTLILHAEINNILGYNLSSSHQQEVVFEAVKPAVRLIDKGVIVPQSENILFPFEAVNLKAVDVRIIQIFENNILQFLQTNQLDQQYQLRRVGRLMHKESIELISDKPLDYGKWNSFSLDLSKFISPQPGAIYRVEIGFRPQHSIFPCEENFSTDDPGSDVPYEDELAYWDYPNSYYHDYVYYDWNERDNPCNQAYYGKRRNVARNIIASNLGIIAKAGTNGIYNITVCDIRTSKPLSDVNIELFNYQQQKIGSGSTNNNGFADIQVDGVPFALVANQNGKKGYLRLADGNSLSLSKFDIGGSVVQKGVKGFIYGERGVWRPGDSIFINFILEDKDNNIPENHPVIFELRNPQNQLTERLVKNQGVKGFYNFAVRTSDNAPTGNWLANVKIGNISFSKNINIETIKPNRLKINFNIDKDFLVKGSSTSASLNSEWLHGAPAKNLKADVTVSFVGSHFNPTEYDAFDFSDPSRKFYTEESTVYEGRLDDNGDRNFNITTVPSGNAPSALKANFTTRVFEEGGEFSIDRFSVPYYPYSSFTGIKIPKGNKWGWLHTDTTHRIDVVTINPQGNPVSRNRLDVKMYKINWRWWWDASEDNLASYVSGSYNSVVYQDEIRTVNGKGSFSFRINKPEWGRYFIRVYDPVSGHAAGKIVYVDWPYGSNRDRQNPEAATMLTFSTDKEKYQPGETAIVTVPEIAEGRALVSVETGSKVLNKFWYEVHDAEQKIPIAITKEMAPNVFVYITLIQPHKQTTNDMPIRLYGVQPIMVEDRETVLDPVIESDKSFRPETKTIVEVKEKNGREMAYTLAIVDEGLLDLTRYSTPDPHSVFYAREALGVKTWDLYDYVLGAYGGSIDQIFSIGGDAEFELETEPKKANRFKPMVKFIGPVKLNAGKTNKHVVEIPKYIGSVRIMLIAGNGQAYGSSEKTVKVKKELMVLATLPRVVGPGELVKLPATVFSMDDNIKSVAVNVSSNEYFTTIGEKEKTINFQQSGDQLTTFDLKVADKLGIGKVTVDASARNFSASYEIEIDVRNPNPPVYTFQDKIIQPGVTWSFDYALPGLPGTNEAVLELSTMPPVDFGRRLKYLLMYPHGCLEQTVSAVFPQLYLSSVMETDEGTRSMMDRNIKEGIRKIQNFVKPDGGFAYWPNSMESDNWATSYTGHFLIEAEKKGYVLPHDVLKSWKSYQKRNARNWTAGRGKFQSYRYFENDLQQAYRLFTLALANEPELGSMNRLREKNDLAIQARWLLASSYAIMGKMEIANELIHQLPTEVPDYKGSAYTYGSALRDQAMILHSLHLLGKKDKAVSIMKNISENLSSGRWLSTQTTAYCLMAISKVAEDNAISRELIFDHQLNNEKTVRGQTSKPFYQTEISTSSLTGKGRVTNKSEGIMFAQLSMSGIPAFDSSGTIQENLRLSVRYLSLSDQPISIDALEQGTDFKAIVSIGNPSSEYYNDLALTQIFPSGWEIVNMRLNSNASSHFIDIPEYQDVRDDRVISYFDLPAQKNKQFVVLLNAAYKGRFYLSAVSCEAMYNNRIRAKSTGKWVEVK